MSWALAQPQERRCVGLAGTLQSVRFRALEARNVRWTHSLDSNENAYGPSPKVADAIRSVTGMVNRYPFRKYEEITERIASFHKVKPDQVLFGCGSTELLRAAACAFLVMAVVDTSLGRHLKRYRTMPSR